MNESALVQYRNKRVAVFGASGFLGAHLVAQLVPVAARVTAFARGAASPSLAALQGADIVLGDVRSRRDVDRATKEQHIVFMMAGRSGAVASIETAREDLDVNCGGLLTVLDSLARANQGARVVFPGSRLQYGRPLSVPVEEDAPRAPLVPYGVHKNMCEEYLSFFQRVHGISFAAVRLTNPYGPSASPLFRGYNVLNLMIRRALSGEAIEIFGDGRQLRDYIYIEDVLALLLRAGAHNESVVINGGSGVGHPLVDVAHRIVHLAGSGSVVHRPWPAEALSVETGDFIADITKAHALGWRPEFSLDEGLTATIGQQRTQDE